MNLEKGSSLLIPEISRPIANDKKRSFEGVGGWGVCSSKIHESWKVRKMLLLKVEVAFSSLSVLGLQEI